MWSLTQGRKCPVPRPYPAQNEPASFPNGSSNFVYHGLSVKAKSTVWDDMVYEYEGVTDELSAAELESLAILERCSFLDEDLKTVHAQLTETQDALRGSLACEASLRAQLDALGSRSPVNYQLSRRPSPSPHLPQTPTTPSHSSTYRTPTTSPLVYHQAQTLSQVDSPVSLDFCFPPLTMLSPFF